MLQLNNIRSVNLNQGGLNMQILLEKNLRINNQRLRIVNESSIIQLALDITPWPKIQIASGLLLNSLRDFCYAS